MCNGIRNSPINIDFSGNMWTEEQQSAAFGSPLMFKGYSNVRFDKIANDEERYGIINDNSRENKLSNKGGHTAVSTVSSHI